MWVAQYMEQRPEEFSEGSADAAAQKIVDQLGKDGTHPHAFLGEILVICKFLVVMLR